MEGLSLVGHLPGLNVYLCINDLWSSWYKISMMISRIISQPYINKLNWSLAVLNSKFWHPWAWHCTGFGDPLLWHVETGLDTGAQRSKMPGLEMIWKKRDMNKHWTNHDNIRYIVCIVSNNSNSNNNSSRIICNRTYYRFNMFMTSPVPLKLLPAKPIALVSTEVHPTGPAGQSWTPSTNQPFWSSVRRVKRPKKMGRWKPCKSTFHLEGS